MVHRYRPHYARLQRLPITALQQLRSSGRKYPDIAIAGS
jgi:hypothetical protein